ncbi:MAG: hypothetical protein IT373_22740 [Polyangiaceae bacterium]|nr:hypothetical protein [Polyangiaceae bacterium]
MAANETVRGARVWLAVALFAWAAPGCGPDAVAAGGTGPGTGGSGAGGAGGNGSGFPVPNEHSWNGSWSPGAGDFPLAGLYDDEYFDGHADGQGQPTPVLPPGAWDWDDPSDDLANWRNFHDNLGDFALRVDGAGRAYGWTFQGLVADVDWSGAAAYFEGSSGTDVLQLGAAGAIHSYGSGELADGPDVLVFDASWSLDFRTGSTAAGALRDDDLVIAGCGSHPDGSFAITTTTIHTGPGSDWVFVRDWDRAGIDLGNGDGGVTSVLDPGDGDDLVVIRGNAHDFRVMGGRGDDVAVWYVGEVVQTTAWLGPNFFGGGGWDTALWDDPGVDRLVLVVPPDTPVVTDAPADGAVFVGSTSGALVDDAPTAGDPYAHYCVECGTSPSGRKTFLVEYRSPDGLIDTGYSYLTAFEELQLGVGPGARIYAIDDAGGTLAEASGAVPFEPPVPPGSYCE